MKKIDISSAVDSGIEKEAAESFIEHRINIKKPLTQRAFNQAIKSAIECESKGLCTATEALDIAVQEGWKGIKPHWVAEQIKRCQPDVQIGTRGRPLQEDLSDTEWAGDNVVEIGNK